LERRWSALVSRHQLLRKIFTKRSYLLYYPRDLYSECEITHLLVEI